LQEGDVVLTIVGTIGRSAVLRKLTEKFTFQRSVAILRPKKEVNPSYLYHYTNTSEFQKNLEMAVNASAQGGVYLGALNKMPIVVPDEPKSQTEIVNILDSIDEKIDTERSYLDKLAKIKSGLMQDLLTGKVRVAA
jgi:type I restriction enzyme S subunit